MLAQRKDERERLEAELKDADPRFALDTFDFVADGAERQDALSKARATAYCRPHFVAVSDVWIVEGVVVIVAILLAREEAEIESASSNSQLPPVVFIIVETRPKRLTNVFNSAGARGCLNGPRRRQAV